MKLREKSIFDVATIVTIYNGTVYYEDAMRILSCNKWPEYLEENSEGIGIAISKNPGFNGCIRFWIENDNAYPIIKLEDVYLIEPDYVFEDLKSKGIIGNDYIELISKGFDIINRFYQDGGIVDLNGI